MLSVVTETGVNGSTLLRSPVTGSLVEGGACLWALPLSLHGERGVSSTRRHCPRRQSVLTDAAST